MSSPTSGCPQVISEYTQAMAQQLAQCRANPADAQLVYGITNLVQGRLLEFLAGEIARAHQITNRECRRCLGHALLGIFSDEFFSLFRTKFEQRPDLALLIARRIIRVERDAFLNGNESRALTRLFPAIFRKYFEYQRLDSLLHIIETDAEIQKIILLARLKQRPDVLGQEAFRRVKAIMKEDTEGLCPNLFLGYVESDRLEELLSRIDSGVWRHDHEALRERVDSICGH